MNARLSNSNPDDERLRALLRASDVAPELPPRFEQSVWRRIEQEEVSAPARVRWFDRIPALLLRPRWVAAALAIFVLAGVISGLFAGSTRAAREAEAHYLTAVNPFAAKP